MNQETYRKVQEHMLNIALDLNCITATLKIIQEILDKEVKP